MVPHLDEEEREHLEKELTLEELKDALMSFSDNKSPGEDGFTKEFYQTFFDLLCKDLLNSYIEAFQQGSLSISQRRGTITLIPKEDINLTDLKNWRPITLLTCISAHNDAENWQTKRQILSLIVNDFSKTDLQEMISGLSKWRIDRAHRHAIDVGEGQPVAETPIFRTRLHPVKTDHFIDYI